MDDDDFLRYMSRTMDVVMPPEDHELIEQSTRKYWEDILCECLGENGSPESWQRFADAYFDNDRLRLGELLFTEIQRYARQVAVHRGFIDG